MPFDPKYFDQYRTAPPSLWPAKLAEEITKYPKLVDPEFLESAIGYQKAQFGPDPSGAKIFGWRSRTLAAALYPGATGIGRIPDPSTLAPERFGIGFITRWNRAALLDRLTTGVLRGPHDPVPLPEFYRGISERAGRFGLQKELWSKVGSYAPSPQLLQEALFPPTPTQRVGKILGGVRRHLKGNRVPIGLATGLLGLYAMQPGSWFSGKDDAYNSIEGLPHGGTAQRMRRFHTDFGSGYRGIVSLPKNLQKYMQGIGGEAILDIGGWSTSFTTRIIKEGKGFRGRAKDFISLAKLRSELEKSTFKAPIVINPSEIGKTAKALGLSRKHALRNIISHERFHQMIFELGGFKKEFTGIAQKTSPEVIDIIKQRWRESAATPSAQAEEYIASAVGFASHRKRFTWEGGRASILVSQFPQTRLYFSGKGEAYNTIEGLKHGGLAEQIRKLLTSFGSGWRGLMALPKVLQPLVKQRGMSMTTQRLGTFLETAIKESSGGIKGKLLAGQRRKALAGFLEEAGKYKGAEVAVINPLAIRKAAQKQGIAYSKALKGTISHERFHQAMRQSGLRGELDIAVPQKFANRFSGRGMRQEDIAEEYIAYAIESKYVAPRNIEAQAARSYYKQNILPAFNMGNTIEAFGHSGIAGATRSGHGFGSGRIIESIAGFAKKLLGMRSPTKRLGNNVIFNAAEIRSGAMDSYLVSKGVIKPPMIGPVQAEEAFGWDRVRESLFESGVGLQHPTLVTDTGKGIFGGLTEAKTRDILTKNLRENAAKIRQREALHKQACVDRTRNVSIGGKGHRSMKKQSANEMATGVYTIK
jgi:hypothetical protein